MKNAISDIHYTTTFWYEHINSRITLEILFDYKVLLETMTLLNSIYIFMYSTYILLLLYPFLSVCLYFFIFFIYTLFYVFSTMLFATQKDGLSNFVVLVTCKGILMMIFGCFFFFPIAVDIINGGRMVDNSPGLWKEMAVSTLPWGTWWQAHSHTASNKKWQSLPQLQGQVLCTNDGCSRCELQVHLCKCGYPR